MQWLLQVSRWGGEENTRRIKTSLSVALNTQWNLNNGSDLDRTSFCQNPPKKIVKTYRISNRRIRIAMNHPNHIETATRTFHKATSIRAFFATHAFSRKVNQI